MTAWGWWLVATCILLVAEMLTLTFVLACLAAACLIAALTAAAGGNLTGQLLAFALGASGCFFWLWRHRTTGVFGQRHEQMNVDRLLGARGQLIEAIDPATNAGRVRLAFEQWRAASADGVPLPCGTEVVVVRRDGTTLFVQPAPSSPPAPIQPIPEAGDTKEH